MLVSTLVELADNLVDRYDVIEVLTLLSDRCVQVIDVSAAGVMLAQPDGVLQFVASSNESMRILELFQVQASEGPCMEVFTNGSALINDTLDDARSRWPRFTPKALAQGVKPFTAYQCGYVGEQLAGSISCTPNFVN